MKCLFKIFPDNIDAYKCVLICEITNEGFFLSIKNDETNTYIAAAVFEADKPGKEDFPVLLQQQLEQQMLLAGSFKKVYIIYSIAESALIPFSLYNSQENNNVLNLVHGDYHDNYTVLTDIIPQMAIYNIYRVSTSLLDVIKSKFPVAEQRHQYTVLLNQLPAEKDKMMVTFYPKKLILMLIKNNTCIFINNFYYDTAEDVSYILLNTCRQFEMQNIPVELSGLIEKKSSLFNEIHKYFTLVTFTGLPAGCNYSEEIINYPAHYFSHIFAADSCA